MRLFDYPKVSKLMEEAGIHLKGGIHCQRQVEMSYRCQVETSSFGRVAREAVVG